MVHSESERGTTVTVALPACTEPRASELDASDDAGAILVVDEDEWVRTVITRVLRRAGYGVLEADSAASAVATLHGVAGRCVRLVLADAIAAGAPRVGLTDVIEQQHPDTRLLLMTSRNAGTFDPPPGASLRDRVLVKPFTPAELLGAVRLQLS